MYKFLKSGVKFNKFLCIGGFNYPVLKGMKAKQTLTATQLNKTHGKCIFLSTFGC